MLICALLAINFTSCLGDKINSNIVKLGLKDKNMQRIAITNNRYAGRYTIIDKNAIDDFTNTILKASNATYDSKLDPDFVFEFFDDTKNVATFRYIAGINDKNTANLIDSNGKLYRVSTSIENGFMRRLMNTDNSKNVSAYYISLLKLLIDKTNVNKNDIIVADISKDYVVTRSITSIEQKDILDSVDSKGARIVFPSETTRYNYMIKINTTDYTDNTSDATASVTDKNNVAIKYEVVGTFTDGSWNYHIKYK